MLSLQWCASQQQAASGASVAHLAPPRREASVQLLSVRLGDPVVNALADRGRIDVVLMRIDPESEHVALAEALQNHFDLDHRRGPRGCLRRWGCCRRGGDQA